jgi:hypothetical protein
MAIDHGFSDYQNLRTKLHEIVSGTRISSVDMICEQTGIDEDSVKTLLQHLVDDNTIKGCFSDDGKRFFLSDIKISDAPIILREEKNLEDKTTSTNGAKLVALIGFIAIVLGWILQQLTSIHQGMENAGVALVMVGLVIMTAGCIQFSRYNPPEKLR